VAQPVEVDAGGGLVTLIIYASQLLVDQHFAPFFAEPIGREGDFLMHPVGNFNDCAGDFWDEVSSRPYFHRYTDDAIDLCDVLSSFAPGAKAATRTVSGHGTAREA
jgi:hypothetical protein